MERRMTSVEIQAYSVDAAVRLALEQLDLAEDDVDIEILSDTGPNDDAEALVRVTAKGMASQPEVRAPRGHDRGHDRAWGRDRAGGDRGQDGRGGQRAPGDRPSSRSASGHRPHHHEPGEIVRRLREQVAHSPRADEESERVAMAVAHELFRQLGIDADAVAVANTSLVPLDEDDPNTIFLDIIGQDLGLLIGRRGENLTQLQYLITLLVNRRLPGYNRVVLDVEGYRLRREESLIALAERVSRQVARSRRPVALDPMPANERRVIHIALRGNDNVLTESSGEGTMRRIMVKPRD